MCILFGNPMGNWILSLCGVPTKVWHFEKHRTVQNGGDWSFWSFDKCLKEDRKIEPKCDFILFFLFTMPNCFYFRCVEKFHTPLDDSLALVSPQTRWMMRWLKQVWPVVPDYSSWINSKDWQTWKTVIQLLKSAFELYSHVWWQVDYGKDC